ncbi:MAG: D-alanyl-D-alanine carboxypeptidase, partial [Hyphomicrobiales bacterium]|nr:D-alanyl-D-alanine carboxypeptidase [Hyphomicrobiales bacterium]
MRLVRGVSSHVGLATGVIALTAAFAAFAPSGASAAVYGPSAGMAEIVIDGNTGKVLSAKGADQVRHPASLTKVMTLYLLFERLASGKMTLDTRIPISAHAASMPPTKLGLRPGSTISVRSAVEAIVTRSANDMAVALAEAMGGTESNFARMMTAKARQLGMTHSNFVNASGLPADAQLSSASDMARLGLAIHRNFPKYFAFFSTEKFHFRNQEIYGHNHVMANVAGVDGIKTGYTRASGFNLLTSMHRDGRFLVASVFGGRSAVQRDRFMTSLLGTNLARASTHPSQPFMVAEARVMRPAPKPEAKSAPAPTRVAAATPPAPIPAPVPVAA